MSDVFQEVEEELRRDNLLKLWKRYQYYIFGIALLIVVGTAGAVYWRHRDLEARQAEGARFAAALDLVSAGKNVEAAAAFSLIADEAHAGSAMLARFQVAALKAKAGDEPGAVAAYDALAKDASLDPLYRDMATVLWGMHALDTTDASTVIARMAPLTAASNPWHDSALELTAIAHLKAGDRAAARGDYQRLADDLGAPQPMRARAAEMVAALAS